MIQKIHPYFIRLANQGTRFIAIKTGQVFPFYYVTEYPRSGGTWIAHLLSEYMQIPFPKHSILPIASKCVIHNHWPYHKNLDKPVYVIRDGRDVAISMMFYAYRRIRKEKYYAKRFPSLFKLNKNNHKEIFPQYLKEWYENPVACKQNWFEHVQQWTTPANVIVVKYENFICSAGKALSSLLNQLNITELDEELINITIQKYSFEHQTKRQRGQEDKLSNKRKGIVGDWKNYFSRETVEYFHEISGQLLFRLGYEHDQDWYKNLELEGNAKTI